MAKRNSRNSRNKESRSEKSSRPQGRGDFVFKDRTGKVHTLGGRNTPVVDSPERQSAYRAFSPPVDVEPYPKKRRGLPPPVELPYEKKGRGRSKNRKERRTEKSLGPWGAQRDTRPRREPDMDSRERERQANLALRNDPNYFTLKATIDKNKRGFAFLNFENRDYEDSFLPPREAERFFHGDRVEALISKDGEVIDLTVLEHRFREVVGRYYPIGPSGTIIYERRKAREEIPVHGPSHGAKSRDWVRAKLIYPEAGSQNVLGEIQKVYGPELPSEADIGMVAAEYNLIEHHSPEAVEEAKAHKLDLHDPERIDLRHLPFITIDGETARDFDDAIHVERDGDGYILWVAIADVSHYVKEDTVLNKEAYSRATSVYFPERAFHMLPGALSENLCSLRPKEPRLTMTAKIHLDGKGARKKIEVMNTLIESRRRATYNEIQAEWEANREDDSWEFRPHFELYQLIRKRRNQRGSIDFDLPEAEIRVDETGDPVSILHRARLDAHRLIEEFMISANEAVTEWALERTSPFIYRVHEEPSFAALERFQNLCAHNGVNCVIDEADVSGSLNRVIQSLDGHPSQTLLNMALLRSMPQARYSAAYGIHFGLASKAYTHFTSPIRRYPDLIVHRVLKDLIRFEKNAEKVTEAWRDELNEKLEEMAEHCSYRERIAADAERESIKLKQVRIMLKEVGNEFEGKVNGMMENGIFVGLQNPFVEGVIPKEALLDDQYEFIEDRMIYVGRRKKRIIHIGDPVKIRVMRVDFDLRTIDFELLEHTPAHAHRPINLPVQSEKRRSKERGGAYGRGNGRSGGGDRGGRGSKDRGGRGGRRGRR